MAEGNSGVDPTGDEALRKIAIYDPITWRLLKFLEKYGYVKFYPKYLRFSKELMREVELAEKAVGADRAFLVGLTRLLLKRGKADAMMELAEIIKDAEEWVVENGQGRRV
jgi:hypothetical protein